MTKAAGNKTCHVCHKQNYDFSGVLIIVRKFQTCL